jgi:hypothetical protein
MFSSPRHRGTSSRKALRVLTALAVVIVIAWIAGPVIHAGAAILRIAAQSVAFTVGAVAGAVILVLIVRVMIRHHRTARDRARMQSHLPQVSRWLGSGVLPQRQASGGVRQVVRRQPEATATREPGASCRAHAPTGGYPAAETRPQAGSRWP